MINTWIEEGVDNLFTLREEQLDMIDIQSSALSDLELQIATRLSQLNKMPQHRIVVDIDRARQLRELFERIDMSQETFESRGFTRLKQLKYLIRTQQIDGDFFWRL